MAPYNVELPSDQPKRKKIKFLIFSGKKRDTCSHEQDRWTQIRVCSVDEKKKRKGKGREKKFRFLFCGAKRVEPLSAASAIDEGGGWHANVILHGLGP